MKNAIIILSLMGASASVNAQSIWGTLYEVKRTVQEVNGAAKEAKTIADQFKDNKPAKGNPQQTQQSGSATQQTAPATAPIPANRTVISIEKCDFNQFRTLLSSLKANTNLTVSEQSFNEGAVSTITVMHSMSEFDLFDIVDAQMPGRLSPNRMDKNVIVLLLKS